MWTFVSLMAAALPGVVAWWTGRRLLIRRDDPALPERIVARSYRLVQVMGAAVGVIFFVSPHTPWLLVLPLLILHEIGIHLFAAIPGRVVEYRITAFTLLTNFFHAFGAYGRYLPALAVVALNGSLALKPQILAAITDGNSRVLTL